MLTRFINFNEKICKYTTPKHYDETMAYNFFHSKCLELMIQPDIRTVLDIGSGRTWHFSRATKDACRIHLIGLDIDASELEYNTLLDQKIVSDVTNEIPLPTSSVDLIMVRAGVEHFCDNDKFLSNCARCLRPGGTLIATFANKYAPFAILNQLLPRKISQWLLYHLIPGSKGVLGFPAAYDRTSYSGFKRLLQKNDYAITYHYSSYFSSAYFYFFASMYIVSLMLDLIRFILGIRNLCSYHLFVATITKT